MSVQGSFYLRLRPFDEIDTSVPEMGITAMPGKLVALSHPINSGSGLVMVDRERYYPDIATVVSSGIRGFSPGEVVVLAPDHGAFYPGMSPDGRECRMVGVIKPWWESIIGKWGPKGFAPAPGWILIERDLIEQGTILTPDSQEKWANTGYIVSDCTDLGSQEGDHVCFEHFGYYEFDGCLPESFVVVNAMNASKGWMRSLESIERVQVK